MMMLKPSTLPLLLLLLAALVAVLPTGAWTIPALPHQRTLFPGLGRQWSASAGHAAGPLFMARNGQGQQTEVERDTFRSLPGLLAPFHGKYENLILTDNLSFRGLGGPSHVSMIHVARFQETLDLFIRTAMSHTDESARNNTFRLWTGAFKDRKFKGRKKMVTLMFQIEHLGSPVHDGTHFPFCEFIRKDIEGMGGRLELGFGGSRGSSMYARMFIDCFAG